VIRCQIRLMSSASRIDWHSSSFGGGESVSRIPSRTTSSIDRSWATISYALNPEYIVRALPNREDADNPLTTAPEGLDIGGPARDLGSTQNIHEGLGLRIHEATRKIPLLSCNSRKSRM
jgi:hypothetical protein